jgi:hypothetical protein
MPILWVLVSNWLDWCCLNPNVKVWSLSIRLSVAHLQMDTVLCHFRYYVVLEIVCVNIRFRRNVWLFIWAFYDVTFCNYILLTWSGFGSLILAISIQSFPPRLQPSTLSLVWWLDDFIFIFSFTCTLNRIYLYVHHSILYVLFDLFVWFRLDLSSTFHNSFSTMAGPPRHSEVRLGPWHLHCFIITNTLNWSAWAIS